MRTKLLLILASFGATSGAQAQAALAGRVQSANGAPLSEAQVTVQADSGATWFAPRVTRTGADGRFAFAGLSPGPARLVVRRLGYARKSTAIVLEAGRGHTVDIALVDASGEAARIADSVRDVEHRTGVAMARARGRHWSCDVPRDRALKQASDAFTYIDTVNHRAVGDLGAYNPSVERASFVAEFTRPLSRAECRRLAVALDNDIGLERDTLEVFRFGTVFYFPNWMFVNRKGKILSVFVAE